MINVDVQKKKYIVGRGFVDSIRSVLKSVGSYISTIKDLIANPVLRAIGSLAGTAITAGILSIINHLKNKNKKLTFDNTSQPEVNLSPEAMGLLNNFLSSQPVTNIIGSGVKKNKRKGTGLKTF